MEEAYVAWELEEDRLQRLNAAHVISEVYGIGPIDSTQLVNVGFWTYPPLENEAAAAAQAAYEEEMESGYGSAESSMDIMNFPEQDVLDNAPFEPNQPGIAPGHVHVRTPTPGGDSDEGGYQFFTSKGFKG